MLNLHSLPPFMSNTANRTIALIMAVPGGARQPNLPEHQIGTAEEDMDMVSSVTIRLPSGPVIARR
jgi:hypothetical protein